MSEHHVVFDGVWKKFHRGQVHDSLRDLIPALAKRIVGRGANELELQTGDFWAVKDLSFEVVPGQTLGIIGPNGSGKSTTLKLLTRILEPTRGYAMAEGRVGTLIEVSAGFHGDLTGRENVFLQGAIMGMRSSDIARKFDQIVEFAGVGESIDTPVKRYSSGMNARLGFSIAAHLEPDVLIIDEVLAVGDMSFQERAFGRIKQLANSGIPVVIVSHQLDRVAELCTDVIVLNNGEASARGTASDAIAAYVNQHDATRAVANTGIVALQRVTPSTDQPIVSGERFSVEIEGAILRPISELVDPLRIRVRSMRTGLIVYRIGAKDIGAVVTEPGQFRVRVELQANLPAGNYMVEVVAYDFGIQKEVASAPSVMFRVEQSAAFGGSVQLNASAERIFSPDAASR